jgi:hypothetical protein
MLPLVSGCAATGLALHAGNRQCSLSSFDDIRKKDDQFVVLYKVKTVSSLSHNTLRTDNKIQLLVSEKNISKPLDIVPDWFDTANSVPIIKIDQREEIEPLGDSDSQIAYNINNHSIWIMSKDFLEKPDKRLIFTENCYEYRELWGYPVCIIGAPIGFAIDLVTWPIQVYIVAKKIPRFN